MIMDRGRIYDGWVQLEAGVDAGRTPTLIDPNQAVSSENLVFRGGRPSVRPGIRLLAEFFSNGTHTCLSNGVHQPDTFPPIPPLEAQNVYRTGIFQCALGFSPHLGDDCIMALIGGRLFKIIPMLNTAKVTEIIPTDSNSPFKYTTGPKPWAIYGVTQSSKRFSISHDHSKEFKAGGSAIVTGSAHNNGTYTVAQVTFYQGYTVIQVTQTIPSSIADGRIKGDQQVIYYDPYNGVPSPYRNRQDLPIAYMVQADKWFVAQDGNSKAILYDGNKCRRAIIETTFDKVEVPTGTMMAYGNGRLVVVVNDRDVAFGDLYGSHLDTQTDPGDSIILFTERTFLAGGFDAAVPFQQGLATGIVFFPQLDTSTGNGQLLVFAERGAASFNTALDRATQWQTSAFQILALLTTGCRGHRSIASVNEDLWFRGEDGYRAFRQARSDSWGWAHLPLSTNVGQFLDLDDGKLLKFASSVYFDNRIIGTTSPTMGRTFIDPTSGQFVARGAYHDGLVVVDFDILSSFGTKYKPTWEGHWTPGVNYISNLPNIKVSQVFSGLFNGVTRAFFFGLLKVKDPTTGNVTFTNQLYEFSLDDRDDFEGPPPWELVTRAFDFKGGQEQSNPFTENDLYDGDLWLSDIARGGVQPQPIT